MSLGHLHTTFVTPRSWTACRTAKEAATSIETSPREVWKLKIFLFYFLKSSNKETVNLCLIITDELTLKKRHLIKTY